MFQQTPPKLVPYEIHFPAQISQFVIPSSADVCPTCLLSVVRLISCSLSNTFQGSFKVHFPEEPPAACLTVKGNNGPEPVKKHLLEISRSFPKPFVALVSINSIVQALPAYSGQRSKAAGEKKKKAPSMH